MTKVKFIKNYAGKTKGDVEDYNPQLAHSLVTNRKVATYNIEPEVKPKTKK